MAFLEQWDDLLEVWIVDIDALTLPPLDPFDLHIRQTYILFSPSLSTAADGVQYYEFSCCVVKMGLLDASAFPKPLAHEESIITRSKALFTGGDTLSLLAGNVALIGAFPHNEVEPCLSHRVCKQ